MRFRRILIHGAFSGGLLVAVDPAAYAQGVPVIDVQAVAQGIKSNLTQALQWGKQLQQAATQLQQYSLEIQNTTALPMRVWAQVSSDIMQVRSIAQGASLLSGNTGSVLSELNSAGSYANRIGNLPMMINQFGVYRQMAATNLSTMGRQIGLQQGQEQNDAAVIMQLQQASNSSTGQLAAIQAGNSLAVAEAQQLEEIQASLSTQSQLIATAQAEQDDRNATDDAWVKNFVSDTPPPVQGTPAY